MEISFRQATLEDVTLLETMENICFSDPWNYNMIYSELSEPLSTYWFAFDENNKEIGYIGFCHVLDEMHIMNVAVLPEVRGKGVGNEIMKRLISEAYARKITGITLEVRESNTIAKNLYEKFGFKNVGIRPHYYMDGENANIYWLILLEQ